MDKKHGNSNQSNKNANPKKSNSTHKVSQNRKLEFSTKKVQKIVSWALVSLIVLSLLFNFIFFVKYNKIQKSVKEQQAQVNKELNQSGNNTENKSDKAQYFTERFLSEYFTIPKDDAERDTHLHKLSEYFYKGYNVDDLFDYQSFKGSREFVKATYVNKYIKSNNQVVLYYDVDYKNITTVEEKGKGKKAKQVDKSSDEKVQVAVTLQGKNNGYAVVDNPKLTSQKLHSTISEKELDRNTGNDSQLSSDSQLKSSIKDFLTSYGTSDDKLSLLSNYDNGLQNQSLEDYQILNAYQEDGNYNVKVFVTYKDSAGLKSNYTYNLIMSKQKDKYFVDKIEE